MSSGIIDKIHEFDKFGSVLGLERISSLLELLGNPQDDLKYIHVAGTNGKGSVCKYLYNTLEAAGYKTGLYTSPFLEVFNERIELHGEFISDEDLTEYTNRVLEKVKVMTDRGEDSPTEFEVITAVAFLYFKEKGADVVVLEVGLGGTGDSTNVISSPLCSVITSISFDHTDRLGNTLAEIASNKAGIIKDGCPVVTSAVSREALDVIEKTAEDHGSMFFETGHIPYTVKSFGPDGYAFDCDIQGITFEDLRISMLGEHQIENAICALAALNIIEERGDLKISLQAIYEGFYSARQIGRLEIMSPKDELKLNGFSQGAILKEPVVIIDGAHNPDGARVLNRTIKALCKDRSVLMVTGMLADKDVSGILEQFTDITKDFIVTEPPNPRKLSAEELGKKLENLGAAVILKPDYRDAVDQARAMGGNYDVVLYAGSLYLIGVIRSLIK